MLRGQVRHLLRGEYWQRVIAPPDVIAPETYQNGAYWATASGWVIDGLKQIDPTLAQKTLADLVADFQANGIWECINDGGYQKVEHYVVSITNPRGALRRL